MFLLCRNAAGSINPLASIVISRDSDSVGQKKKVLRDFCFLASISASLMSQMSGITAASESAPTVLRPYKVWLPELR